MLVAILPHQMVPLTLAVCTLVCLAVTLVSHMKIDRTALADNGMTE
jgi:hypothetical protein